VRRFTPHDLRSTARSHLAALGVQCSLPSGA
jgi:integrase